MYSCAQRSPIVAAATPRKVSVRYQGPNRNVPTASPARFMNPRSLFFSPLSPFLNQQNKARMFQMLKQLEQELDSSFGLHGEKKEGEQMSMEKGEMGALGSFPVDVCEDKKEVRFVADMPGITKENLKVKVLEDRMLLIEGERAEEKRESAEETKHMVQRFFGKFSRAFHLPASVDEESVKASLKNGVLTVCLRKRPEPEKIDKSREINIEADI